ncbi:MAG: energy transducer TonB [Paludibacteraceae bacterium]|nr:energy transducer TonB [Paludibacteraceae bacterium]
MSDTLKKNDSKIAGAVGTILVHLLLLLAILFLGLRTVLPTEEEGLTVNYGNTDSGDGLFEPAPMSDVAKELEQELPQEASVPDVSASQNEQITQDTEESIEIKKQREEAKRKERERLAEEKRKHDEQARIERERREREEKIKKAASTAQNAFSGTAGKGTDTGATSEGIAGGTGNQGKTDGVADSKNYTGGGTGASSYSLNGRSIVGSVPKPQYQQNVEGIIVVTIEVDATGKVISARAGAQGTTIGDASLRKAAEQAALKAKFNQIGGTTVQTGTIT